MYTQLEFKLGKTDEIWPSETNNSLLHQRHDVYYVLFTGENQFTVYLNKKEVKVAENTIVFVSPNCLVGMDKNNPPIDILYFTSTFYSRSQLDAHFLQNNPLFPPGSYFCYRIPKSYGNYVYYILDMMYQAFQHIKQPLYNNLLHNLLEQMLLQCTLHGTEGTPVSFANGADYVLISLFKEYVAKDIRKSRAVKYYADKLNVTPRKLTEACQKVLGKTPKDAITDYIIAEFKWQLKYTGFSIKEIGREYGFLDENNFSSFFTKEVGISPKEFRKP